jgi:DNA replication licensing factor MCM5
MNHATDDSGTANDGGGTGNSAPIDIADHVTNILNYYNSTSTAHADSSADSQIPAQAHLHVGAYRKYIQYAKAKCEPLLSEAAGEMLTSMYVKIRETVRNRHNLMQHQDISGSRFGNNSQGGGGSPAIPITVRQLEALVRIAESRAKMRLDTSVEIDDVKEAMRLFQVSTLAANAVDSSSSATGVAAGGGGMLGQLSRSEVERTEAFLRARMTLHSMVNKNRLVDEAVGQGYEALAVHRALQIMHSRGELSEKSQGRMVKRIR